MSASDIDPRDAIERFLADEISITELQDILRDSTTAGDRDAMWARWAEQGLFDEPIDRDEWVSRKNGEFRTVRTDG